MPLGIPQVPCYECAFITVAGQFRSLGSHATAEEAARAYDKAAREAFGEFACTNADLGLLPRCSPDAKPSH
jgi:hypothetical protein